jgi:hypothetical protein
MKDLEFFINKIISSVCFKNKETAQKILRYLYDAAVSQRDLKEIHIAEDIFHRGKDFYSHDDTIVRVNFFNLRQLLEKYYSEEGRYDEIKIKIPKRKYCIIPNTTAQKRDPILQQSRQKIISLSLRVLVVFSLLLNIVLITWLRIETHRPVHPVWQDFIESKKPTLIVLGNPLFFKLKNTIDSSSFAIRNLLINSEDKMDSLLLHLPNYQNLEIYPLEYPYFSKNNVWPLPEIFAAVNERGKSAFLKSLSDFDIDDLNRNNIIFVANINSFGFFKHFLDKTSIRIKQDPRQIVLADTLVYMADVDAQKSYTEYAFLVKIPGNNNNHILLIGDFHSSGNKGILELISQKERLNVLIQKVEKQYKSFPRYFEMLIRVRSYDYSNIEPEIIYFNKLNESME